MSWVVVHSQTLHGIREAPPPSYLRIDAFERPHRRLGLSIPYDWWPAAPILKEIEAAGFRFVQVPSPPPSVLVSPRDAIRHAAALSEALGTAGLARSCTAPGRFGPALVMATWRSRG